jgi:hypothetical protein
VKIAASALKWRKSSRCETGQCVEMARVDHRFALRSSVHPDRGTLVFDAVAWAGFVAGAKQGDFDLG